MPTYENYIQYAGIRWKRIKKTTEKASLWTYTKRIVVNKFLISQERWWYAVHTPLYDITSISYFAPGISYKLPIRWTHVLCSFSIRFVYVQGETFSDFYTAI